MSFHFCQLHIYWNIHDAPSTPSYKASLIYLGDFQKRHILFFSEKNRMKKMRMRRKGAVSHQTIFHWEKKKLGRRERKQEEVKTWKIKSENIKFLRN